MDRLTMHRTAPDLASAHALILFIRREVNRLMPHVVIEESKAEPTASGRQDVFVRLFGPDEDIIAMGLKL